MYNYFDSIVCISLEEATERREQCIKNFKEMGIDNYSFYKTQRHKEGGRFGCFMSHINVIKKEYDKGSDNVLIFEDDFVRSPSYNTRVIQEIIDYIDTQKGEWNIIYLGHCITCSGRSFYIPKKVTKSIYKMKPCCMHAYIISRKGMMKILEKVELYLEKINPKNIIQIDEFVYDVFLSDKTYGILPSLFQQNNCMESYNEPNSFGELISRSISYILKKTKLSKTCDYSHNVSLFLYHNTIIVICLLMSIIILTTYKK